MSAFRCPKCGFTQFYATLRTVDGAVFDNPRQTAHHSCPNDGSTLVIIPDDEQDEGCVYSIEDYRTDQDRRRRNATRLIIAFIAGLLIVLAAGFKFYTGM